MISLFLIAGWPIALSSFWYRSSNIRAINSVLTSAGRIARAGEAGKFSTSNSIWLGKR